MKVRIAFVTRPGTDEIDTDRVGTIEDHPTEDALRMIRDGIAGRPTDDELADWDAAVAARLAAEGDDLASMTVKQLRDKYPAAAALPAGTKKDDVIAAVEEARRAELTGGPTDQGEVGGSDTTITTVAPGVGEGPGGSDDDSSDPDDDVQ